MLSPIALMRDLRLRTESEYWFLYSGILFRVFANSDAFLPV